MASEAVIAQEALEVRLFDADLVMDGNSPALRWRAGGFLEPRVIGLAAPHDGIDERGGSGAEIEGRESRAVGRLQKRLVFLRGEEEFRRAIGIVIEQLHARGKPAGRELVGQGFGADELAPKLGTEMRGVQSAENAVPVSVIALPAQQRVAGF